MKSVSTLSVALVATVLMVVHASAQSGYTSML